MAVYTTLAPSHIQEIEDSLNIKIITTETIKAGIVDSTFKVKAVVDGKEILLILKVHETPDVRFGNGTFSESEKIIKLLDHTSQHKDDHANILQPRKWPDGKPYGVLNFPHAKNPDESIQKVVSVVPFAEGQILGSSRDDKFSPATCYKIGKALASFQKAASEFPEKQQMLNSMGYTKWVKMAGTLSEALDTLDITKITRDVVNGLLDEADYVTRNWHTRTKGLPKNIIHGDLFPDNVIESPDGKLTVIDLGRACYEVQGFDLGIVLNVWATRSGEPVQQNVREILRGYNDVMPIPEMYKKHYHSFVGPQQYVLVFPVR